VGLSYFQLSIAYADNNYCFANFKYAEGYVNISINLNILNMPRSAVLVVRLGINPSDYYGRPTDQTEAMGWTVHWEN
jgi:hypothetical protein